LINPLRCVPQALLAAAAQGAELSLSPVSRVVLDVRCSMNETARHEATVFVARSLCKIYRMGEVTVQALRDLDLEIFEGEFVVLLGPSGSGKSTLLNILGGLDVPSSGEAFWRDHDLASADETMLTRYRRDHVGFVFQFYNLIPSLTVRENVELVTDIAPNPMSAAQAIDLVGLTPRTNHFPSQLSGGEQQHDATLYVLHVIEDFVRLFSLRLEKEWVRARYGHRFERALGPELLGLKVLGAVVEDERGWSLTQRGMFLWVQMMSAFFESVDAFREQMRRHVRDELGGAAAGEYLVPLAEIRHGPAGIRRTR
jgi:ABC-type uncharacterized transport system YnjBCD ATPase subunit